jgi:hypothetical protein
MAKAPKYVNFVTPKGTARFPKLSEPDTKGEYADNKYKTEIVLDDDDLAAFKKEMYAAAKELLPNVKSPEPADQDFQEGRRGQHHLQVQAPPAGAGRTAHRHSQECRSRPGSVIKVAGTFAPYEKGALKGITAYLDAVRVYELKQRRDAAEAFGDAEDGYSIKGDDRFADAEDEPG